MENYNSDYVSVINSILILLDYQEKKLGEVRSSEHSEIISAAISSAKAASILNVPVIITSGGSEYGPYLNELIELFPAQEVIKRTSRRSDALDDERILKLLKKYGRSKVILSGLWTSECLIETAVHAIEEGYDVFGLIDGCGDISHDRHNLGVHRMLKVGVTPITWMSLASEWMNAWTDPLENDVPEEIFGKYNIMLSYLARH